MTAFRASYADWKVIKTRACVQVVLEIPIEQADAAYQVLGGMPLASKEVWCGVARLEQPASPQRSPASPSVDATPRPVQPTAVLAGDEKPKKSPAQIAGYLCTRTAFQKFLHEKFNQAWLRARSAHYTLGASVLPEVIAADVVRELCEVESRADIHPDNTEWLSLMLAYKLWQNHPELEDA